MTKTKHLKFKRKMPHTPQYFLILLLLLHFIIFLQLSEAAIVNWTNVIGTFDFESDSSGPLVVGGNFSNPLSYVYDDTNDKYFISQTSSFGGGIYRYNSTQWKTLGGVSEYLFGHPANYTFCIPTAIYPAGIVLDSKGTLFAVDLFRNRIVWFDNPSKIEDPSPVPNGVLGQDNLTNCSRNETLNPFWLAFDSNEDLWVSGYHLGVVYKYEYPFDHSSLPVVIPIGETNGPQGIFIDMCDYLYLAMDYKILVYSIRNSTIARTITPSDSTSGIFGVSLAEGTDTLIATNGGQILFFANSSRLNGTVSSDFQLVGNTSTTPPPNHQHSLGLCFVEYIPEEKVLYAVDYSGNRLSTLNTSTYSIPTSTSHPSLLDPLVCPSMSPSSSSIQSSSSNLSPSSGPSQSSSLSSPFESVSSSISLSTHHTLTISTPTQTSSLTHTTDNSLSLSKKETSSLTSVFSSSSSSSQVLESTVSSSQETTQISTLLVSLGWLSLSLSGSTSFSLTTTTTISFLFQTTETQAFNSTTSLQILSSSSVSQTSVEVATSWSTLNSFSQSVQSSKEQNSSVTKTTNVLKSFTTISISISVSVSKSSSNPLSSQEGQTQRLTSQNSVVKSRSLTSVTKATRKTSEEESKIGALTTSKRSTQTRETRRISTTSSGSISKTEKEVEKTETEIKTETQQEQEQEQDKEQEQEEKVEQQKDLERTSTDSSESQTTRVCLEENLSGCDVIQQVVLTESQASSYQNFTLLSETGVAGVLYLQPNTFPEGTTLTFTSTNFDSQSDSVVSECPPDTPVQVSDGIDIVAYHQGVPIQPAKPFTLGLETNLNNDDLKKDQDLCVFSTSDDSAQGRDWKCEDTQIQKDSSGNSVALTKVDHLTSFAALLWSPDSGSCSEEENEWWIITLVTLVSCLIVDLLVVLVILYCRHPKLQKLFYGEDTLQHLQFQKTLRRV